MARLILDQAYKIRRIPPKAQHNSVPKSHFPYVKEPAEADLVFRLTHLPISGMALNLAMSPLRRRHCFLVLGCVLFVPFCCFILFSVPGKRHFCLDYENIRFPADLPNFPVAKIGCKQSPVISDVVTYPKKGYC
ncbi:hypothetical protein HUJ05_006000 [Dendroctonus ponderosae]|nr:hypothetical protein HUJ05_006000 [Dendroctonus ponderosae]